MYPNADPMCSEPLTVGGGVSMEKISARVRDRSNRYTPPDSQACAQRSPIPSSVGLSGTRVVIHSESRSDGSHRPDDAAPGWRGTRRDDSLTGRVGGR